MFKKIDLKNKTALVTGAGKGLGKAFYSDLTKFSQHKINYITCEVNIKPKNRDSIIFHKKYGFNEVGTQKTENGKKEVSLMKLEIA